jgi:hypothetical protein
LRVAPALAQAEITGSASVAAGAKPPPSHPRVVLLALTDDDPLAARLAAELEALGLDVTRTRIDPSVPIEEMVRQALTGGARGVVVADGRRTEFWVAEEGSDRVAMRQELEIENSPAMESVLSLRTVEFLRVSLGLTSRAVVPPPVVPPVVPQPEAEGRLAVGLVGGAIVSTGRLAPFPTAGLGVRVRVVGPLGIELRGLAPLMTQQLAGPDGPVDTSVWLAGGGLSLAPWTTARAAFDLGAGAMAVVMRAAGTAMNRSTAYGVGLALYGRAAGRIRLSPNWSVRLEVLGGSTAARPVAIIDTDQNHVTKWGVGFVAALAGIEWGF